jgi:hypothetical protein
MWFRPLESHPHRRASPGKRSGVELPRSVPRPGELPLRALWQPAAAGLAGALPPRQIVPHARSAESVRAVVLVRRRRACGRSPRPCRSAPPMNLDRPFLDLSR